MDLAVCLKALGDPTRLKIFRELLVQKHCTQALAWKLGISEPGVSQHLKILREAGLVYREKYGYHVHYMPAQEALDFISDFFVLMRRQSEELNRDPLKCECKSRREQENEIILNTVEKEAGIMRIAVPYDENGAVFQHFGHAERFKLYDARDGRIIGSQVIGTEGFGHGALAGFLLRQQVDCLLCGGIGAGAQAALAEAGIRLYAGCEGSADEAAEKLLAGTLDYQKSYTCDRHGGHQPEGECSQEGKCCH